MKKVVITKIFLIAVLVLSMICLLTGSDELLVFTAAITAMGVVMSFALKDRKEKE